MELLYVGISKFCKDWPDADMLQQTFDSLKDELSSGNDGTIDAAKAMVECVCRVIIKDLDDPNNPIENWDMGPFPKKHPSLNNWIAAAIQLLSPSNARGHPFNTVAPQHFKIAKTLNELRNNNGPLSHGRDGFLEKLSTHHRSLAVLSADAIISFLHETYLTRQLVPEKSTTSTSVDELIGLVESTDIIDPFTSLSAIIDEHCVFTVADIESDSVMRVKIAYPDDSGVELRVDLSELLFHVDRTAYKNAFYYCKEFIEKNETV